MLREGRRRRCSDTQRAGLSLGSSFAFRCTLNGAVRVHTHGAPAIALYARCVFWICGQRMGGIVFELTSRRLKYSTCTYSGQLRSSVSAGTAVEQWHVNCGSRNNVQRHLVRHSGCWRRARDWYCFRLNSEVKSRSEKGELKCRSAPFC